MQYDTTKKQHVCGVVYCRTCKGSFNNSHICYMKVYSNGKDTSGRPIIDHHVDELCKYIFYDIESQVDATGQHSPNLLIAHKICANCVTIRDINVCCVHCGRRRLIFNSVDNFMTWLLTPQHFKYTLVAHCGRIYDSYFILDWVFGAGICPTVLFSGMKLLLLEIDTFKIRFIDSYCFASMSLKAMCTAFGVHNHTKSTFPHRLNTPEFAHKCLSWSAASYYDPDSMTPVDRAAFMEWYPTQVNNIFDFDKELYMYCDNDVTVLRLACINMREMFLQYTGLDGLARCITLPSFANLVFRANYLQPNTIAALPHCGVRSRVANSKASSTWLAYLAHKHGIYIQTAKNQGEMRVCGHYVDGYNHESKTCYLFNGCHIHGHITHIPAWAISLITGKRMGYMYHS